MPHRLRLDGRELYAWCAWDTLFLPRLIGEEARVESTCRASGEAIALNVSADEAQASGPEPVLSFLLPDPAAVKSDVVSSFCHYVHFFRSAQAAQQWIAARPGCFVLSLANAFELGRRVNVGMYGES